MGTPLLAKSAGLSSVLTCRHLLGGITSDILDTRWAWMSVSCLVNVAAMLILWPSLTMHSNAPGAAVSRHTLWPFV